MNPSTHVLVVDDEEDTQRLFSQRFRRLQKEGRLIFHFARSGEEALTCLRREARVSIVLVLSDINLPGMRGLELLRHLKEKAGTLRVYFVSGEETVNHMARAYRVEGLIDKPLDFDTIGYFLHT